MVDEPRRPNYRRKNYSHVQGREGRVSRLTRKRLRTDRVRVATVASRCLAKMTSPDSTK